MLRVQPDGSIEAVDMDTALAIRARIVGQAESGGKELLDLRAFVLALKAEFRGCETLEELLGTVRMLRTAPPDERLRIERNYWHSRSMELSQDLAAAQRARPRQELFSAPSPANKAAETALADLKRDAAMCRRLCEEAGLSIPRPLAVLLDTEATLESAPEAILESTTPLISVQSPSATAVPPLHEESEKPSLEANPAEPAARRPARSAAPVSQEDAAELARIRARLGWSQAKMAAAIGTQQSELSKMERGRGRIRLEHMERARELLPDRDLDGAGALSAADVAEGRVKLHSVTGHEAIFIPMPDAEKDAPRPVVRSVSSYADFPEPPAGQRDSGTAGQRDSGTAGQENPLP